MVWHDGPPPIKNHVLVEWRSRGHVFWLSYNTSEHHWYAGTMALDDLEVKKHALRWTEWEAVRNLSIDETDERMIANLDEDDVARGAFGSTAAKRRDRIIAVIVDKQRREYEDVLVLEWGAKESDWHCVGGTGVLQGRWNIAWWMPLNVPHHGLWCERRYLQ